MQFFLSIFTPGTGYHQKSLIRENLRLDGIQFRFCPSFNFLATYIFQTAKQTFIHFKPKEKKKKKLNLRSCFSFLKVFTFLNRFRGLTHTQNQKLVFFQKLTACLFGARNDCVEGFLVDRIRSKKDISYDIVAGGRRRRPNELNALPSAAAHRHPRTAQRKSSSDVLRSFFFFFLMSVYYPLPTCHTQTLTALFGNSV